MIKKIVFFLFIIYFAFFSKSTLVFADDCDPDKCDSGNSDCLREAESACLAKLKELGTAKNTIANQISLISSQINLTFLKINQTENSIKTLEKEIDGLTVEIDKLNIKLNELSSVYVLQVVQNYKLDKKIPPFAFLISSKLNNFLAQYKYVANAQKASQNSLVKMETVRSNYDAQKTIKATKQAEMETLQKTLASQKISLNSQKIAKNSLLDATKNDEKKYQQLLLAVQSKFSSFASTGAQCLSSPAGGGSDGNYFSQIDPRWCNQKPAGTEGCIVSGTNKPCTIGNIGCYISSTAIVLKKLGVSTNPSVYASDINHIKSSADMTAIDVPSGYKYCKYQSSDQQSLYKVIDSELSSGRYVIAQVPMNPYHFIVLISGSNGSYQMHDPWKGADLHFNYSRMYSIRLITTNSCP